MKLAFVVNRIETEQADYTTIRLARKAAARGHELAFFGLADFILGRAVEQDALGRRHAVDPRRQPRDPQRHRAMEHRGQHQAQRKRADQRDEADPLGLRERMRAQDPLRQDRQHNPVRRVQFARRDIGIERFGEAAASGDLG
mgnify:CR=1 FL=1